MVVKVYVSGISGNKEVKKRQQRVLLILDSRGVKYEVIDIAEPGNEEQKDFMQNNSTSPGATISDPNPRHALPPQIFNDDQYCGDYDQFDMANEVDEMDKFLKLAPTDKSTPLITSNAEITLGNGDAAIAAVLANTEDEKNPAANDDTKDEKVAEDETNELTINSGEEKATKPEAEKQADAKNDDETVKDDEQEAKNGDDAAAENGENEVEN